MKKILGLLLVLFGAISFVGCTDETTTTGTTAGTDSSTTTATTTQEPITLRFACWRDCGSETTQERYPLYHAVQKFEELHPNVTVEILRAPMVPNEEQTGTVEQPWHDYLASLAATNAFPDVYNTFNMPSALLLGWAEDFTALAEADEEFSLVYEDIRNSGKFFDNYYAVAYMYEFFGYFINKTLFDDANVDYPEFGFTMEEMLDASKAIARLQEGGNSILGMSGPAELFNYYPAQLNPDYGWYAWDEEAQSFEVDSPEFAQAVALNLQIRNDKTHVNDALTPEERAMYFGTNDWWYPWWNGQMGLHFDFSIMMSYLINARDIGDITFDFDFIGVPKGDAEAITRTPIKPTYMMIGKNTDHQEMAYELMKWLSFDPEGYAYRLQVSRTEEDVFPIISPPLTTDDVAHTAFFVDTYPGYPQWQAVIENGHFYFDAWAVMPGFIEARWEMLYQEDITMAMINDQIGNLGTQNIGDHAAEIKRLMNAKIAETYEELETILGIQD
ncbi:MAG: extracellular solute-binding protein [Bacilli bacterium]|nr:extracellular solute-binding protein [Bacilli bacterium]